MRRCLSAVADAPIGAAVGTLAIEADLSTAAPEPDEDAGAFLSNPGNREVTSATLLVSNVPSSTKLATDAKLENDKEAFAFALHKQTQQQEQGQELGVEQAEFLLAIGLGLPRGP